MALRLNSNRHSYLDPRMSERARAREREREREREERERERVINVRYLLKQISHLLLVRAFQVITK